MGRKSKTAARSEAERDHYRRRLVSCVDCGVICVVSWVFQDGTGVQLDDLGPESQEVAREVLGDDQVDRQGFGVNRYLGHRCPPTRSTLTEVETGEELAHVVHVL